MMGKTEQVKLTDLTPHPRNVRQGDVGAISESLQHHGQYRPIVAQKSTGHILAGNHTYKAAKALKWKTIETTWVDCDDDEALRILLVDNRANDLANYDDHALTDLLKVLMDTEQQLAGTGFDPSDLQQVIEDINFTPLDDTSVPRLDQREPNRCPECGFEWRVGKKGEIEPV